MIILFDWGFFFFQCYSIPKSWKCGSKSCLGRTRFILECLLKLLPCLLSLTSFFNLVFFLIADIKKKTLKKSLCRAPGLNSNCSSVRCPVKMSSKTMIPFDTVKMSLCLNRFSCLLWTTDSSSARSRRVPKQTPETPLRWAWASLPVSLAQIMEINHQRGFS